MSQCHTSHLERQWFRLITWHSTVNFFLRPVGYFPEASFTVASLFKPQICHGNANPRGTDVEARRKLGGYLRGCHILGLRLGSRYSKICDNHLRGGVGREKLFVALVELLYLLVAEPVLLASLDEGIGLGIHSLVGDVGSPGIVDALYVERQPAAVARLVGEEREVVARGT